ncbi:MAG: 4-alpha-glucanotransferase [Desulforhabdus sp.]|nr:4-alpha-glucanotransferase [Desulforhabdus sp.]
MQTRRSGILLHITSLPSPYGIGDFGHGAYRFADFLASSGQNVWQVLPLEPTSTFCGNSPYCTYSAFAGNPVLISPDLLIEQGFLHASEVQDRSDFADERVDFDKVSQYKYQLLQLAFERFVSHQGTDHEFNRFCEENAAWLDDYALFISLKKNFGGACWNEWPPELRDRDPAAIGEWKERLNNEIFAAKFFQYLFSRQWSALKKYCNGKNIQIMGDIPIYVSLDSADVWTHPHIFKLDEAKRPVFVAGVPPDYFSSAGQLWGNPVYNWESLRENRYSWWIDRVGHNLTLFDMIRLDHFRGFVGYWEVAATEATAVNGRWVEVPTRDFFDTLLRRFPYLPIIAEDLGTITPDVREAMARYGFAGMKLLLFAFGDDLANNPYVPHNHTQNSVVYTGTHDNNTVRGWFSKEASDDDKNRLFKYLGRSVGGDAVHWELVRMAMMSIAATAIVPIQDVLGLGEEARMNLPAAAAGNWGWRLREELLTNEVAEKLLQVSRVYGRS